MGKDDIARVLLGVVAARFGPGAIGRIGTITIAGLVVLALIAIVVAFVNVYVSGGVVLLLFILAIYSIERSYRYADRHPELAAMDGAQISKVLTQQSSMKPLPGLPPPPEHSVATLQNPLIVDQQQEQQ